MLVPRHKERVYVFPLRGGGLDAESFLKCLVCLGNEGPFLFYGAADHRSRKVLEKGLKPVSLLSKGPLGFLSLADVEKNAIEDYLLLPHLRRRSAQNPNSFARRLLERKFELPALLFLHGLLN